MMTGPTREREDPHHPSRQAGHRGDVAERGLPTGYPRYSPRDHQALRKAGQIIVDWAVEVARFEVDLESQWVHGHHDDPVVTANALARLLHDARWAIEHAEAMIATLPDDES